MNSMLPNMSFLIYSYVESLQLLNIEFHVKCSVPLKKLILDKPFSVPTYAQHHFTRIKILILTRFGLFIETNWFLSLLSIDVQELFYIASNDLIKKALIVSMCLAVTSKLIRGHCGSLIFAVVTKGTRNQCFAFGTFLI